MQCWTKDCRTIASNTKAGPVKLGHQVVPSKQEKKREKKNHCSKLEVILHNISTGALIDINSFVFDRPGELVPGPENMWKSINTSPSTHKTLQQEFIKYKSKLAELQHWEGIKVCTVQEPFRATIKSEGAAVLAHVVLQ